MINIFSVSVCSGFFYTTKILVASFFLLLFSFPKAVCQTLTARYTVTQEIINTGLGKEIKLATIESTGYLFKKGGHYLYYEKPGYLQKYPDGHITIQTDANISSYNLSTDTLQRIYYTNADSLYRIYRPQFNGPHGKITDYRQQYEADFFNWEVLPETKVIGGLKCQKATMSINNKLQWIIWFTPKVHMQGGVKGIIGAPGLVVEAECPPIHTKYILFNFSESVNLNDSVFNLAELKGPYDQMPPLLKANTLTPGKSKIQKQAELTNQ